MRLIFFVLACLVSVGCAAGERCIAIDGDTLVCDRQKVRLTNVYAVELNEPGGYAAKRKLQKIIGSGEVTLRPYGQDRYGRTLAEVYVDGRHVEQTDIGPRAGRGSRWQGDRHVLLHHRQRPPKICIEKIASLFCVISLIRRSGATSKLRCCNKDLRFKRCIATPNKSRYSSPRRPDLVGPKIKNLL